MSPWRGYRRLPMYNWLLDQGVIFDVYPGDRPRLPFEGERKQATRINPASRHRRAAVKTQNVQPE